MCTVFCLFIVSHVITAPAPQAPAPQAPVNDYCICHPIHTEKSLLLKLPIINDQIYFCLCLDLEHARCKQIVEDNRKQRDQTREIAAEWYKQQVDPCWENIEEALICLGNRHAAEKLMADTLESFSKKFKRCR